MSKSMHQFLCCDVNARLSTDVIMLLKESNTYMQLQKRFLTYEEQQKSLLKELHKKINILPTKKADVFANQPSELMSKIAEFIDFIMQVWENANTYILKKSSKLKYYTKDGIPVIIYLHKLTTFIEHIYSNYYQTFPHPQCCSAFLQLSNQLSNILYPDLSYADTFEQNLSNLMWSISFLANLHIVIDLYTCSTKLDITSFASQLISEDSINCDMKLSKDFLPSLILSSLLKGELLEEEEIDTTPIVEDRISKFYKIVADTTYFLIKITPMMPRIQKNQNIVYKGCLNASYARITPQAPSHRVSSGYRGRGRSPRGAYSHRLWGDIARIEKMEKLDLVPIRVPSLLNTTLFPIE
ncbi:uncharacterized protein isoform X3 [Rhodnius prolixus]|uniref:Uncharacterized protein n=1 Tax=Rhodnius prolixus TaxID=13249 RepID=T1HLN3_RHOPR